MQSIVKVISALFIIVALVFGYFLFKSNWDFTLAKSMMVYEVKNLMGDATDAMPKKEEVEEPAADVAPVEPSSPSHTKDSIYEGEGGSGEASFTDMKRTGNESSYN